VGERTLEVERLRREKAYVTQPVWAESEDPSDSDPRYANSVTIGMSQWDLTIDFGLATPAPGSLVSEMRLALRPVSRIVMSPTHAKVLAEILTTTISEWEHKFGRLPETGALMPSTPASVEEQE
jgi:hypothetical protein